MTTCNLLKKTTKFEISNQKLTKIRILNQIFSCRKWNQKFYKVSYSKSKFWQCDRLWNEILQRVRFRNKSLTTFSKLFMMWQILGEKFYNGMIFLDQSFTRCQKSIQHFPSVWVLEPIYTQSFRFRINTTTRREILKQNIHNDVPFWIKNLTILSGPDQKIFHVLSNVFTMFQLLKGRSDFGFWIKVF